MVSGEGPEDEGEGTARYVVTGPEVPLICPGTLAGINLAMNTAIRLSKSSDKAVRVEAVVHPGERRLVRVYHHGRDITEFEVKRAQEVEEW